MDEGKRVRGAKTPTLVALALLASYGLYLGLHWGALPERLATHFAASGEANGWMGKGAFLLFQVGLLGVLGLAFFGLPRLLGNLPAKYWSLPNRDYWTAPEHLPELRAVLAAYMGWMGVLVLGLMACILALTVRANLSPEPRLPASAGPLLALFLAAEVAWVVLLLTRLLRRPKVEE